jgi:hypothetical protein
MQMKGKINWKNDPNVRGFQLEKWLRNMKKFLKKG